MLCKKCGKEINANDQFCPHCGEKNENANKSLAENNVVSSTQQFDLISLGAIGSYVIVAILYLIRLFNYFSDYHGYISYIDDENGMILALFVIAVVAMVIEGVWKGIMMFYKPANQQKLTLDCLFVTGICWLLSVIFNSWSFDTTELVMYVIFNLIYGKYALISFIFVIIGFILSIMYIKGNGQDVNKAIHINTSTKQQIIALDEYSLGAKIWIILCIIFNFISAVTNLTVITLITFLMSILGVVVAVSYILLLNNKSKNAFFIIVIVAFVIFIMNLSIGAGIYAIFGLLNPLITYALIYKNWDYLK